MVLNYIWVAFFVIAFVFGLVKWIFMGDMEIFPAMTNVDIARVIATVTNLTSRSGKRVA